MEQWLHWLGTCGVRSEMADAERLGQPCCSSANGWASPQRGEFYQVAMLALRAFRPRAAGGPQGREVT
jgi:hypothetical protein